MTSKVLIHKLSRLGHCYVELLEDGKVKAGYYQDTAKTYDSMAEAYARFRDSFNNSGNHSAWNICYILEDYMQQENEGR